MNIAQLKKQARLRRSKRFSTDPSASVEQVAAAIRKTGAKVKITTFGSGVVIRYGSTTAARRQAKSNSDSALSQSNRENKERTRQENYAAIVKAIYKSENYDTMKIVETTKKTLSKEEKDFYATLAR